jgi:hypothetical protein
MRHKKFNEVYSYTYYIKCKNTGIKYHGVRYGNIKKNLTPLEDFAKVYFTSGKLHKDFKKNTLNYSYRICLTFDSIEEALEHESLANTKLMYRNDWEVWNNSKAIVNKISPSLGRKIKGTIIAERISKSNKGKIRSDEMKNKISLAQKRRVIDGSHHWTLENHKNKCSKRAKENNPSKNGLSEEHRKKIGDSQRGKPKGPQSEEHKKNNSLAHKGIEPWNKGLILGTSEKSRLAGIKSGESRRGKKRGKYKPYIKLKPSFVRKASCLCCHRQWDLGNLSKHLRKQNEL